MSSKHLKYAKYLYWHKYYVFTEGVKRGLFFRVIIHDWDKFLPSRWMAYANWFGVPEDQRTPEAKSKFMDSWRRHAYMNDHHWQYWVGLSDKGRVTPHEMSDKARTEMLVDWISAHRTSGGTDLYGWYLEREETMPLAPNTRKWIKNELQKL